MIEAACFHKVARFVHVSSGSVVFNFKDFLDADENLPYVFHGTCIYIESFFCFTMLITFI